MTGLITFNVRQLGRVFAALSLAIAALVLLLGIWGRLPTVEAREPAVANTGSADTLLSSSNLFTYYVFLPILLKSDLVFYDNFSNPNSGWPHEVTFEDCYYEYRNGTYRVKVTDNGQRCLVPHVAIPKQINGTFRVKVKRTSDEEDPMLYGLIFGAGADATADRWALEIYPNNDSDCGNKPFYWLYALVDGDRKYFKDRCTDIIDKDKGDWNDLKVIRNGSTIKVYLNGESKGEYNDASYLLDKGYTLMEVVSASNDKISVEFDDFEIRTKTTP
jgi:hypothetical protein